MSRRFTLRKLADEDLDNHFLYIAEHSIEAALHFYEAAQAALECLVEMPGIGVVRVLHAKRDIERVFFEA